MFRKRHPPVGSRPGTLLINGTAQPPRIHVMRYGPAMLDEFDVDGPDRVPQLLATDAVCWIDVQGLGSEETLRKFADLFKIHLLALEDVVYVPQRPKSEVYEDHTFCITRMAMQRPPEDVETEQVSVFMGRNYVLTFQERYGDVFDPVRNRIRQGGPVFRSAGPGYLAYALLDATIDGYYPVLETLGERLEALEDRVLYNPQPAVLQDVHRIKRELLEIRRYLWPQREAINSLIREENEFISEQVRVYLRDCYDHCVQMMDVVESYRELAGGLVDVYLSSVGNRQNEVMKVLTIMASIFIPLTFLAGIYGMNFEFMPELRMHWAYPTLLGVMVIVAAGMTWFFWRKGWIGGRGRPPED
mgnify:CR=1 FL=1